MGASASSQLINTPPVHSIQFKSGRVHVTTYILPMKKRVTGKEGMTSVIADETDSEAE